jgi:hypothetical protein
VASNCISTKYSRPAESVAFTSRTESLSSGEIFALNGLRISMSAMGTGQRSRAFSRLMSGRLWIF